MVGFDLTALIGVRELAVQVLPFVVAYVAGLATMAGFAWSQRQRSLR
jgi:hypothetical protein